MITVQAALTGALIGGLYALMAAGLSVTWGVLKIINLVHFGLILIAAYLTFQIATSWNVDPLLTVVITVPAMALLAAALQWAFDRLGVAELNSLLLSFGLLIIVGPFPVTTLLAFVAALVLIGGGHLALQRTFAGRAMRAFAQDRAVAAAFGIDHRRIGMLLAGVSGATAAIAGMLFALANALTPATAYEWFGIVFAVVILGGVGHLLGTLAAGVLVGVLSGVVSVVLSPAAAPFVLFSAIVLALLLRPQGLFGGGAVR